METKNKKIDSFLSDYGNLVKKHKVDFATYPLFIPDGTGGFKIICQTTPIDLDEMKNAQKKEDFISK
jgi:hypothetical protein